VFFVVRLAVLLNRNVCEVDVHVIDVMNLI
jgi:hypothetical protein